jgi:hypothetical protein
MSNNIGGIAPVGDIEATLGNFHSTNMKTIVVSGIPDRGLSPVAHNSEQRKRTAGYS